MKKSIVRLLSVVTLSLLLIPTIVLADFKSEIIESCSEYQQGNSAEAVNACKLYIDGFIDSSVLTEDAAIQNQSMTQKQPKTQSAFMQRAYQTRVTDRSFIQTHKEYQFCLPREEDRKIIASNVAKSININDLKTKKFKEVILETLIKKFPC